MLITNKETSDISIPSQVTPNVWILTTVLSMPASVIILNCPGKATTFIKVEKPIHILQIPTACSATLLAFTYHQGIKTHIWK